MLALPALHVSGESGSSGSSGMHPYPLWPSEPVPGWPGVGADADHTVEKLTGGSPADPRPAIYGQPEFLAYPGAVHHVRREYQRYNPPYPLYNQNTLRTNFVLAQMKGYKDKCVEFAEPVYYNSMYGRRSPTQQRRPPVSAYPWKAGDAPIKLDIGKLKRGVYTIRPIGLAPAAKVIEPRKFVFIKLRINDWRNDREKWNGYILRAQALDNFYALQQFHFHARDDRVFRAEFSLLPESEIDLLLHNIDLHDRNGDLANRRGKKRTVLVDTKERAAAWAKAREAGGERLAKSLADRRRTSEEQKCYDDFVWAHCAPLNCHWPGWTMWFNRSGRDLDGVRLCRVPKEGEALVEAYDRAHHAHKGEHVDDHPMFFRIVGRKICKDARRALHINPPPYEVKGLNVYKKVIKDKKAVPGELLGPLSEFEFIYSGYPHNGKILHKGKDAGNAVDLLYMDGELYKDGKLVDDEPRRAGCPYTRYYDEKLRNPLLTEWEVEPGLYYDACKLLSGLNVKREATYWTKYGDRQAAWDMAMNLVCRTYSLIVAQIRDPVHGLAEIAGSNGHDRSLLKYFTYGSTSGIEYYDKLFEFIDGNEEFAKAVGRYIPGIETSDDVVTFLDTYIIQYYGNLIVKQRQFTDHGTPALLMKAVLVQDDTSITDPWMEFLFKRSWEYPQALSGLGDNLVTGGGRDGASNIGSFFYGRGGQTGTVDLLEKYIRNGGNPKYDVADPEQYPSSRMTPYFALEASAAGRINPGIGDVGGPAEYYGRFTNPPNGLRHIFAAGWQWHKDPKFAWELVNQYGKKDTPDAEWAEIVAAAKECPRDPFLMNRSRVLSNWGGYITSNPGLDDFRFMREATVRVGTGWGHAHSDTLDLRLFAFGCTMVSDFNQRPAYGWPRHQMSRCHNLVEVDGRDWMSHAWVRNLFDAPGGAYLEAESVPPHGMEYVHLFRRQTALLDVDGGQPARGDDGKAAAEPQKDPNVVLPSCYLFDVFRVRGGTTHTYCFHGCVEDGLEVNVKDKELPTHAYDSPDGGYLRPFRWHVAGEKAGREGPDYWVGKCDGSDLEATWRLDREAEKKMLRGAAVTEPRKYTRLVIFDQEDSRIMHGIARHKGGVGYYGRCLYAQKTSPVHLDSVFVALIEPYAGEPTITARRQLRIDDNEADAFKAVAVKVTTKNGHTDVLFADGRPDRVRRFPVSELRYEVSGEYAYVSKDRGGLRQATLTAGRLLATPDVRIEAEHTSYRGAVRKVDYLGRKMTVAGNIPARFAGHFFEVGGEYHKTSYEVPKIENAKGNSVLTLRKGLEIMRTRVRSVKPETGTVIGAISMFRRRGRDYGLVASDDALTKFWRLAYTGGDRHAGHTFNLAHLAPESRGPVFTADDFPSGSGLRVWEFGIGDLCSIRTGVSLLRRSAGGGEIVYELYATSPCKITLRRKQAMLSADQQTWVPSKGQIVGERIQIDIGEKRLPVTSKLYIKVAARPK